MLTFLYSLFKASFPFKLVSRRANGAPLTYSISLSLLITLEEWIDTWVCLLIINALLLHVKRKHYPLGNFQPRSWINLLQPLLSATTSNLQPQSLLHLHLLWPLPFNFTFLPCGAINIFDASSRTFNQNSLSLSRTLTLLFNVWRQLSLTLLHRPRQIQAEHSRPSSTHRSILRRDGLVDLSFSIDKKAKGTFLTLSLYCSWFSSLYCRLSLLL